MPGGSLKFEFEGPEDSSFTMALGTEEGPWWVVASVPDIRQGVDLHAVCLRCEQPMRTGMKVLPQDIPLSRGGQWRHTCGSPARLPESYLVTDRRTGEEVDLFRGAIREQVTVSAITMAELLRLRQVARAVQEGRAGAEDRLEQVLAEAPEPIRQIAERWKISDKLQLAGIIVTLVLALLAFMKDDGSVSEQQLVDLVEKVLESNSGSEK